MNAFLLLFLIFNSSLSSATEKASPIKPQEIQQSDLSSSEEKATPSFKEESQNLSVPKFSEEDENKKDKNLVLQTDSKVQNKLDPFPPESEEQTKDSFQKNNDFKEQDNVSLLQTSQKQTSKNPFSIELETEGGFLKNLLSKNQKGFYPHIPYMELSFEYSFSPALGFFTQLEFVSQQNLWGVAVEQVGLSYHSKILPFNLKGGLLPLPLGYAYENLKVFSHPLYLYKLFIPHLMDTGVILEVPVFKESLVLKLSRFKGYLKRPSDNYYKTPEFAPLTLGVESLGPFWKGFATWLKQDLAFLEGLNALGGGFQLFHIYQDLKGSLQGEFWQIRQVNQTSLAYYLFPKLSFQEWSLGVVYGKVSHFSPYFKNPSVKTSIYEWILQASYELYPGISLMGERFVTKQTKGPLQNNLWAVRLKITKEF